MTLRIKFLLVGLLLTQCVANADPITQHLSSEYEAKSPLDITLRTIVAGESETIIAAEIIVSNPRCSGSFSGVGIAEGDNIVIRSYKPAEPSQNCTLTIQLDAKGKVAKVSESNCTYYHGAGCSFAGTLTAK